MTKRRAWSSVFQLFCEVHRCPLSLPQSVCDVPAPWLAEAWLALGESERKILDFVDGLSGAFLSASTDPASWPHSKACSLQKAKDLLVEMVTVQGFRPAPLPIASIDVPPLLRPFIHGPIHWGSPVKRPTWSEYRKIADPALRRAAVWAVGWLVLPGLDRRLFPGWLGRRGVNDDAPASKAKVQIGDAQCSTSRH